MTTQTDTQEILTSIIEEQIKGRFQTKTDGSLKSMRTEMLVPPVVGVDQDETRGFFLCFADSLLNWLPEKIISVSGGCTKPRAALGLVVAISEFTRTGFADAVINLDLPPMDSDEWVNKRRLEDIESGLYTIAVELCSKTEDFTTAAGVSFMFSKMDPHSQEETLLVSFNKIVKFS